jgi:hypothetical protein
MDKPRNEIDFAALLKMEPPAANNPPGKPSIGEIAGRKKKPPRKKRPSMGLST